MFQLWHWLAFANILTSSVSSLYIQKVMKDEDNDPIVFAITFQFILAFIVLLYALSSGFTFPPPINLWPRFMLGAVLYACGVVCSFYANKHIGAGEFTILTSISSLITILLGVTFLGNPFGVTKVIGTVLILSSVFILYRKEKMKFNTGVWYALGVAFFFGVAVINDVVILRTYPAVSFLPLMCFFPGVVMLVAFPKKVLKIKKLLRPKPFQHIVLYALFYGIASVFFYLSLSRGATISQLSPMTRASIIMTVILSALFLGERKDLGRKIVSAILVSIGVVLLA